MRLLHKFVVRDIVVHSAVPRLINFLRLARFTVIHTLLDNFPTKVNVHQFALLDRGRRGESRHDRSEGHELVIEVPGVVNGLGLVSYLQA